MSRLMLALATTTLMSAFNASAEDARIYLMTVSPMTMDTPDRKGIVGDIVLEAIKRAGLTPHLVVVPSPRAIAAVPLEHDTLIIPLARLKEREANFTWIAPIVKVQRAFFTLGKKVDSFEQAAAEFKIVGVSRGTAGVNILLEHGFTRDHIAEVNQGVTAPRMLVAKRFDAWYNLVSESKDLLTQVDGGNRVVKGAILGDTYNYLACSKACDPALVAKLTAALKAMAADGVIKRIAARYPDAEGVQTVTAAELK